MMTAMNGFKSCGLWPYNPDVFTDEDFLQAAVTDEPTSACGLVQKQYFYLFVHSRAIFISNATFIVYS